MKNYESFEQWQSTGQFTPREFFGPNNPQAVLRDDCTDVVVYGDGSYIQCLTPNVFFIGEQERSLVLDDVELILWNKIKSKYEKGNV